MKSTSAEIIQSFKQGFSLLNKNLRFYFISLLFPLLTILIIYFQLTYLKSFKFNLSAILYPLELSFSFAIPGLLNLETTDLKKVLKYWSHILRRILVLALILGLIIFFAGIHTKSPTLKNPISLIISSLIVALVVYSRYFYTLHNLSFFRSLKHSFIFAYHHIVFSLIIFVYCLSIYLSKGLFTGAPIISIALLALKTYIELVLLAVVFVYLKKNTVDFNSELHKEKISQRFVFLKRFVPVFNLIFFLAILGVGVGLTLMPDQKEVSKINPTPTVIPVSPTPADNQSGNVNIISKSDISKYLSFNTPVGWKVSPFKEQFQLQSPNWLSGNAGRALITIVNYSNPSNQTLDEYVNKIPLLMIPTTVDGLKAYRYNSSNDGLSVNVVVVNKNIIWQFSLIPIDVATEEKYSSTFNKFLSSIKFR